MLAQDNEYIGDASATIYKLTREEEIRLQCEAREDYYRRQRSNKHLYEKVCQEKEALEKTVAEISTALEEKDALIAELKAKLANHTITPKNM